MSTGLSSAYRISYILTTYNKLPYLRQVLGRLVAARLPDEEIVVTDGGSNDGTHEYLHELFVAGSIQQFVSERDKGEAHGFNKGMMMAKGIIIKIITDDDAYHYPTIRQAATFMIENSDIDVMMSDCARISLNSLAEVRIPVEPVKQFQQWLACHTPFWMIALPLMIRRKSLALTGLFSTGVVLVDLEFIYRITSLKTTIAWCSGAMSMHLDNPNGNFNRMNHKAIKLEHDRAKFLYLVPSKRSLKSIINISFEAAKRPIRPAKRAVFYKLGIKQVEPEKCFDVFDSGYEKKSVTDELEIAYILCDDFLEKYNSERKIGFLYKANDVSKVLKIE